MDHISRISPEKIDFLKELANIGVGNATTSLSQILNDEKISMTVPEVKVVQLKDIGEYLIPEKPVAAIFFEAASNDLKLIIMFILSVESAELMVKKVLNRDSVSFDEMELSALREIGNIVNSSYINSLSEMTGLTIIPKTPSLSIDMGGAILGTILGETATVDDFIILSMTSISMEKDNLNGKIFLFPFHGSINLFKSMGA